MLELYWLPVLFVLLFCAVWFKIYTRLMVVRCKSAMCLVGKTALITGGNSGIGYEVALALASRGCRIIIADVADMSETKAKIIKATDNTNVATKHLDLSSFQSVKEFAAEIRKSEDKLHFMINNAGVGYAGNEKTADGLHTVLQVNFLGHFLLTHLLLDLLKNLPSKIVFTSSIVSLLGKFDLNELSEVRGSSLTRTLGRHYAISKLCMYLATRVFAEKLKGTNVTCNSVHPGLVKSRIFSNNLKSLREGNRSFVVQFTSWCMQVPACLFGKSAEEGAQSIIHIVCSKKDQHMSGQFFAECNSHHWISILVNKMCDSFDKQFYDEFWRKSEEIVGLNESLKL